MVIAVAGMEGALFSVLAGLVKAPVIAVPTSVGYGVAAGGRVALHAALASCAPGVVVVNIDNGFGAAAAAIKILRACSVDHPRARRQPPPRGRLKFAGAKRLRISGGGRHALNALPPPKVDPPCG